MATAVFLHTTNRRSERVEIGKIIVRPRQRKVDDTHVKQIKHSYEVLGDLQIQDIILNQDYVLVDGAHRLQAAQDAGWMFINATIVEGLDDEDRQLVEAEANRIRKALSPIELEATWRTYYAPRYEALALKKQQAQGRRHLSSDPSRKLREGSELDFDPSRNLREGSKLNFEEEYSEIESLDGYIDTDQLAQQVTGVSKKTLDKVSTVVSLASAGDEVPLVLREAAQVGVEKLSRPGAPVEPVYKALERISAELALSQESDTQRLIRRSGEVYGRLGENAAHMAISLSHADLSEYVNLARVDPAGVSMITGCVNALCEAAATLIAVQVAASDPTSHSLTDVLGAITSRMEEHVFTTSESIHVTGTSSEELV